MSVYFLSSCPTFLLLVGVSYADHHIEEVVQADINEQLCCLWLIADKGDALHAAEVALSLEKLNFGEEIGIVAVHVLQS